MQLAIPVALHPELDVLAAAVMGALIGDTNFRVIETGELNLMGEGLKAAYKRKQDPFPFIGNCLDFESPLYGFWSQTTISNKVGAMLQSSRLRAWMARDNRVFAPPADMKTAMDELVQKLEPGDAHRGQDIYRSSRAACSACHRIGYVGGNIGPELTKIGKSRNRRDFVEAILYPSHRIAQGFASTTILTVDDEVITGLITFEDDSRIELSTSADKKVSVDKKAIQQRNQSAVSLMPSGIDKVLTISELSDLIAFLEQSK
jgi:putative heme-binding domain-containing protein